MALVLSRRAGESIVIGEEIVVTVQLVQGNRVYLAVQARREIPIRRDDARRSSKNDDGKTKQK